MDQSIVRDLPQHNAVAGGKLRLFSGRPKRKLQAVIIVSQICFQREIKTRVPSHSKIHLLLVQIVYTDGNMQSLAFQGVSDLIAEAEGIDRPCFLRVLTNKEQMVRPVSGISLPEVLCAVLRLDRPKR